MDNAVATTIGIYDRSVFPEMKVNWRTYHSNISHRNWPGCFRCHDGKHVSKTGKVLGNGCTSCHTQPVRSPLMPLGTVTMESEEAVASHPAGGEARDDPVQPLPRSGVSAPDRVLRMPQVRQGGPDDGHGVLRIATRSPARPSRWSRAKVAIPGWRACTRGKATRKRRARTATGRIRWTVAGRDLCLEVPRRQEGAQRAGAVRRLPRIQDVGEKGEVGKAQPAAASGAALLPRREGRRERSPSGRTSRGSGPPPG